MAAENLKVSPNQAPMPWVAGFLFLSAIIIGAFSARGFYILLSAGLPISNPWLAITQVTGPFMQAFLGLTFATTGRKRKVFAVVAIVLGITTICCGLIPINAPQLHHSPQPLPLNS